MTTTTDTVPPVAIERRRRALPPFLVAFALGLVAVLALAVAGLVAFDRIHEGRVLPGVRVGALDLSGLAPAAVRDRLAAAYGSLGTGEIVLHTNAGDRTIPFAEVGRHADIDAMAADALAYGRSGTFVDRLIGNAKTAVRGVDLAPRVAYDPAALEQQLARAAAAYAIVPVDARVDRTDDGFVVVDGSNGRHADVTQALAAARTAVADPASPATVELSLPLTTVQPSVTTPEAIGARAAAERIAQDVVLKLGKEHWTIPAATIRSWITFTRTAAGAYQPVVDTSELGAVLKGIAKDVKKAPKNASFLVGKGNKVVGVTAAKDGRKLDVDATAGRVAAVFADRSNWAIAASVEPAVEKVAPALSTEEAEKTAPLMKEISRWTTWFPISEKNGFGANIWIPAMDIDGYVVGPGEKFDFWKAVGPVTRERGYRDGGAIINGRTEPQGALAGGICSTSTTLFNAALRAGFEMGARRNHYYYIDRYPVGLDATVFKSGSGSVQTMSWTNDTKYPVLIRGYKIRNGSKGYVRFVLYSVPNDRTVTFSKPVIKNVRPASDTVQYTSSLAPGVSKRIEYPVAGKDVWVTRTVRDGKTGNVLHKETYYSHYARITGVTLVGKTATAE